MGRQTEKQWRYEDSLHRGIAELSTALTHKAKGELILKRRPTMGPDDFDVMWGARPIGRVYCSADGATWHWRLFATLADAVIDERDRASSRENATSAFRERWDQLKLATRV